MDNLWQQTTAEWTQDNQAREEMQIPKSET